MEKGILTKAMIKASAKKLDDLIPFKNPLLETFDGPTWELAITAVNNNLADKIPEPQKSLAREAIDDIWIDKDVEAASNKCADLYFTLVNIPGIEDKLERQVVVHMTMAVASVLATLNIDEE